MSDIELPDSRHSDLGIDLEKGIFLRSRQRVGAGSGDCTDSGNNSLNTNRSNCSTGTSSSSKASNHPVESSFIEEDEDDYAENIKMSPEIRITKPQINKNIIEVRYRGKQKICVYICLMTHYKKLYILVGSHFTGNRLMLIWSKSGIH